MDEYKIAITLKPKFSERTRCFTYQCNTFDEAFELTCVFDKIPDVISINVEKTMHIDVNLCNCFNDLDKVIKKEEEN